MSVELLTPMLGKPTSQPIWLKEFGAWAKPLRFVDYLQEYVQLAVILHAQGVLVNVPSPARYALHKLVVSQRRPASFTEKAPRDLAQASMLLQVLLADRPGDLILAGDAARVMGGRFVEQLIKGLRGIDPKLARATAEMVQIEI